MWKVTAKKFREGMKIRSIESLDSAQWATIETVDIDAVELVHYEPVVIFTTQFGTGVLPYYSDQEYELHADSLHLL